MTPTPMRTLAKIAFAALAAGWALVALVDLLAQRLLQVPWAAVGALALMAVSLLAWTLLARPRLLGKPGRAPLDPIVATRSAALALAASRAGSAVLGFYAGVALGLMPAWDTPAGRDYALAAGGCALASLLLVGAALWLESLCRLRGGDDEDAAEPGRPSPGQASGEAATRAARRLAP